MNKPLGPDRILVKIPSLRAVKSFVAAAKHQNFTRAAESLCVTQAAISRQIRELEEYLGTDLFRRNGRAIELTAAGQMFFDAAYLSFVNISQAADRIMAKKSHRQELRIGASPAFSSLWLAPRLPRFFDAHHDIDISILTTDQFSTFEPNTRPDVLISMNLAYKGNYKSLRLFSDKVYPVCSPEFLARNPEAKNLESLRTCDLLELSPFRMAQIYEHMDWNFWFYLAGLHSAVAAVELKQPCRANDYNVILQMALNHQGVALGWDHLVQPLVEEKRLVRPVEEEVLMKEKSHYLFYDVDIADSPGFLVFRDWLLAYF